MKKLVLVVAMFMFVCGGSTYVFITIEQPKLIRNIRV